MTTVATMPIDPQRAKGLATAAKRLAEWRTKRDDLIWEAHQEGASLREIAAAVKMTNPGVLSVIRRKENQRDWEEMRTFTNKDGHAITVANKRLPEIEVDEEQWPLQMGRPTPFTCRICGWHTEDARSEGHQCPGPRD